MSHPFHSSSDYRNIYGILVIVKLTNYICNSLSVINPIPCFNNLARAGGNKGYNSKNYINTESNPVLPVLIPAGNQIICAPNNKCCIKYIVRKKPQWIRVIHRIVIAIAIQVQTVDGFGVQVGSIIGGEESAPFGAIIAGIAVVQAGVVIVVITAVTDGICVGDRAEGFLLERTVVGQRSRRLNFALCTLHFALNSWFLPFVRTKAQCGCAAPLLPGCRRCPPYRSRRRKRPGHPSAFADPWKDPPP